MNNAAPDSTPLTPPSPPATSTSNNKFMAIIAALAIAVSVLVTVLVVSGGKTDTGAAPTTTVKVSVVDPIGEGDIAPVNKYDAYYEHVLNNSGQANTVSKSDVIEFGDLVCQSLDKGQTVAVVARVITGASTSTSDLELGAAVIYGAITYLCSEYSADLRAYLAS